MTQDVSFFRETDAAGATAAESLDGRCEAAPGQEFLDALLAALTQMAALSPRRQADVVVAMRRAGMSAAPGVVLAGLDRLLRHGCIEVPLHLSDGGILVSVTMRGIEHLATTSHRHAAATMMAPQPG